MITGREGAWPLRRPETSAGVELDLDDPKVLLRRDVLDDPSSLYDQLRRHQPLWRLPGQDVFVVTSPALIRQVVSRPTVFSSNLVSVLYDGGEGCPVGYPMAEWGDPIHVLATADPPRHTVHRRLLQPHLTPGAVGRLEPAIRSIVDAHLEALMAGGAGDVVVEFADPVPAAVICEVLGLPPGDANEVLQAVNDSGALLDGVTDAAGMARASASALELGGYLRQHLGAALERRVKDRHGLLGVLAEGVESGQVDIDEAVNILVVLASAGSETTASLLATAVATLGRNPQLQEQLRLAPQGLASFIEAQLRASGPFQFHYRWTTAETTVGSVRIPAGAMVLLMWAAANRPAPSGPRRQPALPPAPTQRRGSPHHYAFGRGLHFCIGAPLARLEARIALASLLTRTRSITLDPKRPPTLRPSIFLRRHKSLGVFLEAS